MPARQTAFKKVMEEVARTEDDKRLRFEDDSPNGEYSYELMKADKAIVPVGSGVVVVLAITSLEQYLLVGVVIMLQFGVFTDFEQSLFVGVVIMSLITFSLDQCNLALFVDGSESLGSCFAGKVTVDNNCTDYYQGIIGKFK